MVGYPESLTDPSYRGQILVLTFPLVGNYGVPDPEVIENEIAKYFESSRIHIAALIIGTYSEDFSHYLAKCSLSDWLVKNKIPALAGIDTRSLVKKIRNGGVMLAKVLSAGPCNSTAQELEIFPWLKEYENVEWVDPNSRNLVADVSC